MISAKDDKRNELITGFSCIYPMLVVNDDHKVIGIDRK